MSRKANTATAEAQGTQLNTVRAVMSPMPAPINGVATVHEALQVMRENNVYSLVVERRRPGDEYGMVVISDIANKVIADNRSPDRCERLRDHVEAGAHHQRGHGDQVRDPPARPLRPVA